VSRDSLEDFFQIFDSTDDQGWCDIGYATCERIVTSYGDDEWNDFVGSIERLSGEVHLSLANMRIEFARFGRPTGKRRCRLFAAHARRWAS